MRDTLLVAQTWQMPLQACYRLGSVRLLVLYHRYLADLSNSCL